jgi:hypothetical protein
VVGGVLRGWRPDFLVGERRSREEKQVSHFVRADGQLEGRRAEGNTQPRKAGPTYPKPTRNGAVWGTRRGVRVEIWDFADMGPSGAATLRSGPMRWFGGDRNRMPHCADSVRNDGSIFWVELGGCLLGCSFVIC